MQYLDLIQLCSKHSIVLQVLILTYFDKGPLSSDTCFQKLAGYAMTERPQLCRDQDSNLGCLGHNEKY